MAIKHSTTKSPRDKLFAFIDWNAEHIGTLNHLTDLNNVGVKTHADIDTHISANLANAHGGNQTVRTQDNVLFNSVRIIDLFLQPNLIYHSSESPSDFIIKNDDNNKDILFQIKDSGVVKTPVLIDGSDNGNMTFDGSLTLIKKNTTLSAPVYLIIPSAKAYASWQSTSTAYDSNFCFAGGGPTNASLIGYSDVLIDHAVLKELGYNKIWLKLVIKAANSTPGTKYARIINWDSKSTGAECTTTSTGTVNFSSDWWDISSETGINTYLTQVKSPSGGIFTTMSSFFYIRLGYA